MKYLFAFALLALCSCGTTRVSGNVGQGEYDRDLKPTETPTLVGLEVSDVPEDGGLGFEVGGRWGSDSGTVGTTDLNMELWEAYIGPRYEFRLGNFSPYLSGGGSFLSMWGSFADKGSTTPDRDTDIGFYLGLGVDLDISDLIMVGVGVRKTFDHELTLSGVEGSADAWQYLFRFGVLF